MTTRTSLNHILHELRGRLKKRLKRKRGQDFEAVAGVIVDEVCRSMARGLALMIVTHTLAEESTDDSDS